jgi:hypothetical protein
VRHALCGSLLCNVDTSAGTNKHQFYFVWYFFCLLNAFFLLPKLRLDVCHGDHVRARVSFGALVKRREDVVAADEARDIDSIHHPLVRPLGFHPEERSDDFASYIWARSWACGAVIFAATLLER